MTNPPPSSDPPKRSTSASPFAVWGTTTGKPWLHHVCEIPTYAPRQPPPPPEGVPKSDKPQQTRSPSGLEDAPVATVSDPTAVHQRDSAPPPSDPRSLHLADSLTRRPAADNASTRVTIRGEQSAMVSKRESRDLTAFSAGDADITGQYVRGVDLDDDSGDVGTGRKGSTGSISDVTQKSIRKDSK